MGRNGTRSGRKKLKEDGVDLLNSIADAAFDFAAKAPIEYGKECHEYLDILSQAEGLPLNPAQAAWLRLLTAHGQNDANGVQIALQEIVNVLAESVGQPDGDVLVPTVPTSSAEELAAIDGSHTLLLLDVSIGWQRRYTMPIRRGWVPRARRRYGPLPGTGGASNFSFVSASSFMTGTMESMKKTWRTALRVWATPLTISILIN